jgi:hypothetical protein
MNSFFEIHNHFWSFTKTTLPERTPREESNLDAMLFLRAPAKQQVFSFPIPLPSPARAYTMWDLPCSLPWFCQIVPEKDYTSWDLPCPLALSLCPLTFLVQLVPK